MERPLNPFDPSRPIDPTKFVGRHKEIKELEAALSHAKRNKPRHFLITGERGVGKTSFLDYMRRKATSASEGGEFSFAVVDFAVNKQTTKLDFARALKSQLDTVLSAHPTHNETLTRVWGFIQRFEVAGVSYRGNEERSENHRDMYQELADSLCEIVKRICDSSSERVPGVACDGVLLLVDEVDQSSDELDIGSFLKYLLERLNRKGCNKVIVGLAGLPHSTDVLLRSHASSLRIFDELALANLNRTDVNELLDEAQTVVCDEGIGEFGIAQDARGMLFDLSGGHPHMLHQLGYCAFEAACNSATGAEFVIEAAHVTSGFFEFRGALDLIGDMYFRKPFEIVESNPNALAIIDHLSETGSSDAINELAQQMMIADSEAKAAVDMLVRTRLLEERGGGRVGIRHPVFAFWVKSRRPQRA